MADIVIDPIVPVVPPAPPIVPPVVPPTPVNPADVAKYTALLLGLLDLAVNFVPGQAGDVAKKIDVVVHTITSQDWFNELLIVVVNAIHGGVAPTKAEMFGLLVAHINKSGCVK